MSLELISVIRGRLFFLQISFIFPADLANLADFFFSKIFLRKSVLSAGDYFSCRFHLFFPADLANLADFSLKSLLRKSALSAGDYFSCRFHLFFPADLTNLADFFFLKFFCVNQCYPREIFCYFSS